MQNRLVAQNVFKAPIKGDTYFSINKKMLAYSLEQSIKIKSFNKQGKQYEIKLTNKDIVKNFQLSVKNPWIYVCTSNDNLEIYSVSEQSSESMTRILSIKGVVSAKEIHECIVLDCKDDYYRVLSFQQIKRLISQKKQQIQLEKLNALQKKGVNSKVLQYSQNQNIFIMSSQPGTQEHLITVFSMKKTGKYEKTLEIDYIKNPIAIYRDRYVFSETTQNNNKSLEIYDINQQKIIGKISIEGDIKYAKIKQNIMLLIINIDNTDYYWFCALNPKPESASTLITHKIIYQRGKGDFYDFCNMKNSQSLNFTDKKKQQQINDLLPQQIDQNTTSIIYVFNKQKEKVQIIKLDHSKVLQSAFGEDKIEKKVVSNIVKNKIDEQKQSQNQQNQRNRIKSSLQHKSHHGKTLQETQRKFVQAIVDVKVKNMMQKFQQLEQRVQRLQRTMKMIYEKIDQNMKDINRQQIRSSIQSLFSQLTPQFQKYFSELFKQVSGVLDQGVSFYNKKIAAQAEIHKQALNQIVSKTFEETEKIIEICKKEEKLSQRTEKHLNDLLEARKKWQSNTEEFEQQNRDVAFTDTKVYRQPNEGKVFVRADLNVASKRQT